jgi:hypothetical protein
LRVLLLLALLNAVFWLVGSVARLLRTGSAAPAGEGPLLPARG